MPAKSLYLRERAIRAALLGEPFSHGPVLSVGLDTSKGEVAAADYSRQPITFVGDGEGGASNSAAVQFAPPTSDWGAITGFTIRTADGTIPLYGATFPEPVLTRINVPFLLDIGAVRVVEI